MCIQVGIYISLSLSLYIYIYIGPCSPSPPCSPRRSWPPGPWRRAEELSLVQHNTQYTIYNMSYTMPSTAWYSLVEHIVIQHRRGQSSKVSWIWMLSYKCYILYVTYYMLYAICYTCIYIYIYMYYMLSYICYMLWMLYIICSPAPPRRPPRGGGRRRRAVLGWRDAV